jgi:hypothetical protein
MKRKLVFTMALAGMVLALPNVSTAAPPTQPPTQDSVVLTGGPGEAGIFSVRGINASSGPSGQDPTGQVTFEVDGLNVGGPITCLSVSGHTATMNVQSGLAPSLIIAVQVVDAQPDTFDAVPVIRAATDCSALPSLVFGGPLSGADITVVDAHPLPTTKDQCKRDGWKQFGFANQGLCVVFVEQAP